jgi:Bifunctional DNA primase/polymerase, N-terminal/Primase C terminal 1 (PriCT-1)
MRAQSEIALAPPMATLAQALEIWSSKRSIIPLKKDKKPLLSSWTEFQNRYPSKEEVTQWWTQWPDANLGIVTSKLSNLLVIDVDVRHGGSIDRFPQNTTVIKTGNGGYHLYYYYQEGITNKVGIFPGIDIRGEGGYVVGPYSTTAYVNEKTGAPEGGEYVVLSKQNILPFPAHLFGVEQERKDSKVLALSGGVSEGSRNESAASMAGAFIRAFPRAKETAWKLLKDWNEKNIPPLSEYELRRTFNSIASRDTRHIKPEELPGNVEMEPMQFLTYSEVLRLGRGELEQTQATDIVTTWNVTQ